MIKFEFQKITISKNVLPKDKLQKIAEQEINNTIARTGKLWTDGKAPDGSAIGGSYNPGYRKFREKTGRKGAPVDLIYTGELKKSLQSKAIDAGAEASFMGGHKSGQSAASLASDLASRGFNFPLGFGPEDEKRIEKRFSDEIEKALDEAIKIS